MKRKPIGDFLLILTFIPAISTASAQGTTFTFQGRLSDGGTPATGLYDLRFAIADAASGGSLIVGPLTNPVTPVSNGLFTVTLDFGPAVFTGPPRWLEIGVRSNGDSAAYTTIIPRQALTPSPYSIMANTASNLLGSLPSSQLSGTVALSQLPAAMVTNGGGGLTLNGTFSGNGLALTNVNAARLAGLSVSNFWQSTGNAGANPTNGVFLGTTDNLPLELKVNAERGLRIEPVGASTWLADGTPTGAPNIIGGAPVNFVTSGVVGAFIGGGGATNYAGSGRTNNVASDFGMIAGGEGNVIQSNSPSATIAGGFYNIIGEHDAGSTIGGGQVNIDQSNAPNATISGGANNIIQSNSIGSTIGGGMNNTVQIGAYYSTIGGGIANTIQPNSRYSSIAGGTLNAIGSDYSLIGGGEHNSVQSNAVNATISGGAFNQIQIGDSNATIGGGDNNTIQTNAFESTISGGGINQIQSGAYDSAIVGGKQNTIQPNAYLSMIGGGFDNQILPGAYLATLSGGTHNRISGAGATIPGGNSNHADGINSFAAGTGALATNNGAFVWADSTSYSGFSSTGDNQFLIRSAGGVGIGTNSPRAQLHVSAFGSRPALIAEGTGDFNSPQFQLQQDTTNDFCRLRMGVTGDPQWDIAVGRNVNVPTDPEATELNFYFNGRNLMTLFNGGLTSSGVYINGEELNVGYLGSTDPIFFSVDAFFRRVDVNGAIYASAYQMTSDRDAKKNFRPCDCQTVLDKVANLPMCEWNYKTDAPSQKHLGPMAQDFHAAFGLNGDDDKHISVVDEGGVALAAIQGLNQKLEDRSQEAAGRIRKLEFENAELKTRLETLERFINAKNGGRR